MTAKEYCAKKFIRFEYTDAFEADYADRVGTLLLDRMQLMHGLGK
jgi:hypothetical protein